jgi:hypothetical protein
MNATKQPRNFPIHSNSFTCRACGHLLGLLFACSGMASMARDFTTTGDWRFASLPGHEQGAGSIYSNDKTAVATWQPKLRSVNPVRMSLYLVTHQGNDANAVVEISAAGKIQELRVNMEAGEPRWFPLGEFPFDGKGTESVRVRHGGKGNIRLSALKLEIMDAKDGSIWQTLVLDDVVPYDEAKLQQSAPKNLREGPPNPEQWQLNFSDEFNGTQLDTNVWKSAQGQSWGQLLSARFPENVVVKDGLLRLVTKKENRGGKEWTSAMISTKVFRQKYGYWESRYRYAPATGLNQAFWMNPGSKDKTQGFEIDVNEGHYPSDVNATLHQSDLPSKSKRFAADYDLGADFHLYAAEWNEKEVIFYFDGQEIHRVPNTKANLDVPVIFATAVLPWAGPIGDSLDGASMDVDWVRIYQRKI